MFLFLLCSRCVLSYGHLAHNFNLEIQRLFSLFLVLVVLPALRIRKKALLLLQITFVIACSPLLFFYSCRLLLSLPAHLLTTSIHYPVMPVKWGGKSLQPEIVNEGGSDLHHQKEGGQSQRLTIERIRK